jgi:hypothetical protein
MIRSRLWFVTTSYAALLSACSSTVPPEDSTQKTENALGTHTHRPPWLLRAVALGIRQILSWRRPAPAGPCTCKLAASSSNGP